MIPISGYSSWAADRRERRSVWYGIKQKLGLPVSYERFDSKKFSDLYSETDFDLIIAVGCFLFPGQIELYRYLFDKCKEDNTPILFLGTGSLTYDQDTIEFARDFLESYPVQGMITRDSTAHQKYHDYVEYTHDGIDLGFYINDWYSPPELEDTFVAYTFDKRPRPEQLNSESNTITASHLPYDDPFLGTGRRVIRDYLGWRLGYPTPNLDSDDLFISDNLREYLILYNNVEKTYSDRIHACVPTLMYGGKAQLYDDTDRDLLFEDLIDGDIKTGATIKVDSVNQAKQKQINKLEEIKNNIL